MLFGLIVNRSRQARRPIWQCTVGC